jgi:hypothetical protein
LNFERELAFRLMVDHGDLHFQMRWEAARFYGEIFSHRATTGALARLSHTAVPAYPMNLLLHGAFIR